MEKIKLLSLQVVVKIKVMYAGRDLAWKHTYQALKKCQI